MHLNLPTPDPAAQAHSQKLQQRLAETILTAGPLTFHDYMKIALYEPGLGYYSAGSHKLGAKGDFITAPEISPLFGMAIAQSLMPAVKMLNQPNWLELGAGTGKLAASILLYLAKHQQLPKNYFILEVSADLKQRQQIYLKHHLPAELFQCLSWLDQLPSHFAGIVIANEILDALPVHRFQITSMGAKEYYVTLDDEQNPHDILVDPSSTYLTERIAALQLPIGYSSEINLQQEALIKSLSHLLTEGVLLFIDYGYPAKEYYHPQRSQGTLMCHYQHRAHHDPYFWPGLQDITAHVDFTALATCALQNGLSLITYSTQAAWLMQAGIFALAQSLADNITYQEELAWQQALRKLISPEEMGELFKVILFSKALNLELDALGNDRRHTL